MVHPWIGHKISLVNTLCAISWICLKGVEWCYRCPINGSLTSRRVWQVQDSDSAEDLATWRDLDAQILHNVGQAPPTAVLTPLLARDPYPSAPRTGTGVSPASCSYKHGVYPEENPGLNRWLHLDISLGKDAQRFIEALQEKEPCCTIPCGKPGITNTYRPGPWCIAATCLQILLGTWGIETAGWPTLFTRTASRYLACPSTEAAGAVDHCLTCNARAAGARPNYLHLKEEIAYKHDTCSIRNLPWCVCKEGEWSVSLGFLWEGSRVASSLCNKWKTRKVLP